MFNLDAMQDFVTEYIARYSVLLNIIIAGLQIIGWFVGAYVFKKKLQNAKNELDKNADAHRQQLQVEYLKTEIKTKQLSSLYPELFEKFKLAEALIGQLCRDRQAKKEISSDDVALIESTSVDAVAFMVRNLLFISSKVIECLDCLIAVINLYKTVLENDLSIDEIRSYKKVLNKVTDHLQAQMKMELGSQ